MNRKIVYIDTETTGLDIRTRRIWEVGLLVEGPDHVTEHHWFVDVDLTHADPMALSIGRYWERHPNSHRLLDNPDDWPKHLVNEATCAVRLAHILRGALVVGAVPWFDMETIEVLFRENKLAPNWKYHLVDVETLAAGDLSLMPPWDFDLLLSKYGLKYDEADRHTALGDARMAHDLFKKVMS